jgi:hypothetical protein
MAIAPMIRINVRFLLTSIRTTVLSGDRRRAIGSKRERDPGIHSSTIVSRHCLVGCSISAEVHSILFSNPEKQLPRRWALQSLQIPNPDGDDL